MYRRMPVPSCLCVREKAHSTVSDTGGESLREHFPSVALYLCPHGLGPSAWFYNSTAHCLPTVSSWRLGPDPQPSPSVRSLTHGTRHLRPLATPSDFPKQAHLASPQEGSLIGMQHPLPSTGGPLLQAPVSHHPRTASSSSFCLNPNVTYWALFLKWPDSHCSVLVPP